MNPKYALLLLLLPLTLTAESQAAAETSSQAADLAFSKELINAVGRLENEQDETGAIGEVECLNKKMSLVCRKGTSNFMTAMTVDAIREVPNNPRLEAIRTKAVNFLKSEQVAYGGLFKYYPSSNPKKIIVKFDVDDNALGLSALMRAGIQVPYETLKTVYLDGIRKRTVKQRDGSEKFQGWIFSTWLKPTKPLFNDLDVVVNANALWMYGVASMPAESSQGLRDACRYVNQVVEWSARSGDWSGFFNDRKWIMLKKSDYSTWYPSPYVFAYNIVRAGTDGGQKCLAPSLARIEELLTRSTRYAMTSYDQVFGAAALLRLIESKHKAGENIDRLMTHAQSVLQTLTSSEAAYKGKNRFFYYGASGYIGSQALLESLKIEALSRYLRLRGFDSAEPIPSDLIQQRVEHGLDFFRTKQDADGSWTRLIRVSSVMYACHVIYMYEYMNKTAEKKEILRKMMNFIWTQQNRSGGFGGYHGGPDNESIAVMVYVAAKIAGENELSPRMLALEKVINQKGGLHKAGYLAVPYLMLLGLDSRASCLSSIGLNIAVKLDESLPWARVMMYPVLYLLGTGKVHSLPAAKRPTRIDHGGLGLSCPKFLMAPLQHLRPGRTDFLNWTMSHLNKDGTLFDYTPTTVPTLMALWTEGGVYAKWAERGIQTIESFQEPIGDGLYQSPGEASIGETYVIMNALMDLGYGPSEPMLQKSEAFLYSMTQPGTGGFGFSKHNLYFPDSDDTSNVIYVLKRMSLLRGDSEADQRLAKGLNWLLSVQNSDGGFGTWEKDRIPGASKAAAWVTGGMKGKRGIVLSESVVEHTARIVLNLSLFKDRSKKAAKAYRKALQWIVDNQEKNGGYEGTWFVDYLFGTSMAMTALATASGEPRVDHAIEEGLRFILNLQREDGGFSESPESFIQRRSVPLAVSSPAQTGLIVSQLFMFLREENYRHWHYLKPALQRAVQFLLNTQSADGLWHDEAWSGVTFPGIEYLVYPYIQEISPLQAIGMYRLAEERHQKLAR